MKALQDDVKTVWLDSQGMNITSVEFSMTKQFDLSIPITWSTKEYYTGLGSAVSVDLPINIRAN